MDDLRSQTEHLLTSTLLTLSLPCRKTIFKALLDSLSETERKEVLDIDFGSIRK